MTAEEISETLKGTPRTLYRALHREGYLGSPFIKPKNACHPLDVPFVQDLRMQYRAWLLESLFVALYHEEPIIAFRALLQAYEYAGKVGKDVLASDALLEARNRLEPVMKAHATFPVKP